MSSNKGDMPAFPIKRVFNRHGDLVRGSDGLTLRQWYAGQALAGLLANPGGPIQHNRMDGWSFINCTLEDVANLTGKLADAMLKEQTK